MKHLSRWQGAMVGAILLTVLGVVIGLETLLLVALVAIGLVVLAEASPAPPAEYTVRRSLDTDRPTPGVPVTVTIEIDNDGDRMLPDLRVTEDLPEDVAVVSGTPSFATSLKPGGSASHSYEIIAPRGEFSFGEATVRRRNLAATFGAADHVTAEGTAEFTCETLLDRMPLRQQTIQFFGETPTDTGGSGLEFYSVREYRPGDPLSRIDWNQYARSGTLSTVEYRLEQAVTVVFVIDDRVAAHVDGIGGGPNSFDLSLYAAARGIVASIERGNRTGLATLTGSWVDPGADEGTRQRINDVLDTAATTDQAVATDGGTDRLLGRLPANAQVVVCSPLVDDEIVDAAERISAYGHAVSVLSPDMTTGLAVDELTPGQRVAGLQRRGRIERLRGRDIPVADWTLREPIMVELQRLQQRWSP
ncbi:DUF58 domain-containing protein [Halonotius terrestris]|uniref:DUF58 domain-containing protein n=1 Tax=Halonotius terrestris TaxID=2487750 RepID=A0A8J8TD74_9EURY|nr:DUF58 domain-containing protein [Halonotius terrestris]TQQ83231.1 DUF58 domain-containing protein [Halonotius terrestris]